VSDVFTYLASDGIVTTPGTLTVNVAGSNDAPVTVDDAASVREDVSLTATGNVLLNDTDPDAGTVLTVANAGMMFGGYGHIELAADGSYTYTLDNASAAVQGLHEGVVVVEVYPYVATDGANFTQGTLTVRIAGSNDAPVTADDAASVREDVSLTATGNVLLNDTDADTGTVLTVANAGMMLGAYGRIELAADGSYTYTLDNASAAVQSLRAGQTVSDVFTYLASDGIVTTPGTLTVNVAGSNDAPVTVDDAAQVSEDGTLTASGNVLLNDTDPDAGTVLTVANPGPMFGAYGHIELFADGRYEYTLQRLGRGAGPA